MRHLYANFRKKRLMWKAARSTVNVDAQHCRCRKWLLTAIPCCHAIAIMNFINVNAEDFILIIDVVHFDEDELML